MVVGFMNYNFDQSSKTMNFEVLFRTLDDFPKYTFLSFHVKVSNSTSKKNYSMTCSMNNTYKNEDSDLSYTCSSESVSLQNINEV